MNRRYFSALLIAVMAVVIALVILVPSRSGHNSMPVESLFLPELGARINEASKLEVTTAGGALLTTIEKGEQRWTIMELDHYPADWNRLGNLLADLARASVVELKTSNPAYFSRLGVEDIGNADATGVLLEIHIGDQALAVVVGNKASSRNGQYLRLADDSQSVLIDRPLDVPLEPLDWADDEIVDIASALVAQVEIEHAGGERILARKISASDSDFTLENLPQGREQLSSWSVNSLAGVFSGMRMDAVKADSERSAGPADVKVTVLMFSGVEITAELFEREEQGWIRIRASAPVAADVGNLDTQAEPIEQDTARTTIKTANETASEINERTNGWLYRLPGTRVDSMSKTLEQLLKPLDEPVDAGS